MKYKPGLENKAADALSRCYDEVDLATLISYPKWLGSNKLLQEVKQDADIQRTLAELKQDPEAKAGFSIQQDILFYHGCYGSAEES